ncbi:hypothetical protein T492DRAFT_962969 [Pavlovales sp. CCMP2436]|nr:hypothetical protein T492DRAFT_962969 [Pavlovales sp. CCMP2436]
MMAKVVHFLVHEIMIITLAFTRNMGIFLRIRIRTPAEFGRGVAFLLKTVLEADVATWPVFIFGIFDFSNRIYMRTY